MELQLEPASNSISLSAYWRLVRENRNFRNLWLAQIVSEIGDWFYTLAIYNLLLQLTGRASSVALALVVQVLPQTFMGPFAGVVNDRLSRKRVMITTDLLRALVVLAMLLVRSRSNVWMIYPLLLLESSMWAFFEPARTATIPNVTSGEDLLVANTLSSTTWSLNLVAGASIGGVALALLGRNALFVLNTLSFLASAYFLSRMHFRELHAEAAAKIAASYRTAYTSILDGIRYVRHDSRRLAMVFIKTGLAQMGVSWVLFTVMGQRVFPLHWPGLDPERGGVLGMSMLLGARGVGAIVGPLFSARWAGSSERRLRLGVLLGFLAVAAGYCTLGAAMSLWQACFFVVLAHSGGSTVWVFSTTLLQLNTEDKFRGRVFSAELGLAMVTLAIGSYLTGFVIDRGVAPRTVAIATGVFMLIPACAWALAMRLWKQETAAVNPQPSI
ncbi:MAG: MFS transporter [Terriglobales bacterium]|jgi:predicted MFS family arabinose efflux permease